MAEETFSEDGNTLVAIHAVQDEYIVPAHVRHIGYNAFTGSIKRVVLSEGVESIGNSSFCSLGNLSSISIPSTVKSIDESAFYGCFDLNTITVHENNPFFTCSDGVLYDKRVDKIIAYPVARKNSSYILPVSVTAIPGALFRGAKFLKSIKLHDKVTTIGYLAFSSCYSLASLDIPKSVKEIKGRAFYNCKALTSIVIPDGVKVIEDAVFKNSALTFIELPDSIEEIKGSWIDSLGRIKEIRCHKKNPDDIRVELCFGSLFSSVKLFVPKESIDLYKANKHFGKATIFPL